MRLTCSRISLSSRSKAAPHAAGSACSRTPTQAESLAGSARPPIMRRGVGLLRSDSRRRLSAALRGKRILSGI